MSINRKAGSFAARVSAAEFARDREHPCHKANGDEVTYSGAHFPMSFTKGLSHDPDTGLVKYPQHFIAFRTAINDGHIDAFNTRVPVPPFSGQTAFGRRQWEAPTAGITYDLEGPDAQSVTMAPAPELGSDELAFEMAEVYELALLRDEPFHAFDADGGSAALTQARDRLNSYSYAAAGFPNRPRKTDEAGLLDRDTIFRGSSPGVEVGPYVSQFLLIGNHIDGIANIDDGQILYGVQRIDQRVPVAAEGDDYMQTWSDWLTVQNGADVRGPGDPGQSFVPGATRFIQTPRDLATYVHFDALYQAYLNACLILLATNAPRDPGFAHLAGGRNSFPSSIYNAGADVDVNGDAIAMAGFQPNAGGFALYGGPHILSMVTEVATRALKAARYQKFNLHLRLRPEALAARMSTNHMPDAAFPQLGGRFGEMRAGIQPTVDAINAYNGNDDALLPMAFAEGSPMHPSYAAGHATVAGACVTVLKAFFDTGAVFVTNADGDSAATGFRHATAEDVPVAYEAFNNGADLRPVPHPLAAPLTLEGELNKLAANISIGRNMAGVHYFSDYYDSLRMGEAIAIGMLEEQALCYPTDPFVLSVRTFDGDTVPIGAR
ncbi:vanadium-dependent haloperoxidase [Aestuariibius insulae]|uniref:vanadium-dependent haloperoxidase n=1 Tax=Aestuariibius insulae TaxID=2058287 RepID=UPI00345EF5F1